MKSNTLHLRRAILCFVLFFGFIGGHWGQTTVTYSQRVSYYDAGSVWSTGTAGAFNEGPNQVGMYANGGTPKQVVAWRKLKTDGVNAGTDRSLRVGDEFRISVSANTVVGEIGFALLASPTSRGSWGNRLENAAVSVRLTNYGNWYATYSDGTTVNAATSTGSNNIGGTTSYKNFEFTCLLTAPNRMNITITDGTTTSNLYDVLLNTSNAITEYSIFSSDDWNGANHCNIYWNTNSSAASDYVKNTLTMPIGSSNGSFTIIGALPNGTDANSTSTASVNALTKSGTGALTLTGANTYSGVTTVNTNGTLLLGASSSISSSGPVGTTAAGTTITSGGVLDMNGFSLTSTATEALTISGTGISSGGALINTSGTGSTWTGTVALGTDASVGGSGNITLNGVISGANNLTKIGAGILTLGAINTFGGASKSLTVAAGTVAITSFTDNLGNSNNTFTLGAASTSGTLDITPSATVSVSRSFTVAAGGGTIKNSGTNTPTFLTSSGTYTGTLNGELTVNCASSGDIQFNLGILGAGGITVNNSSTGKLIMGTSGATASTYSGDTKLTAGTLQLGFANMLPNSSKLLLNGGTFRTGASTGYAQTIGTLQLTDNSTIALGTGSHTINFSASNSVAWTASKTLTITGWTGTAGATGTAGKIFVGSTSSGLTSAQLAQISFSGYAGSAVILSTGEIVPKATQFRSKASGTWNNSASWESSTDGSTWVNASATPTSSDGTITIRNGHTVTVASSVTVDEVVIATGGLLDLNGGSVLTINNGTGTDLDIYGTFIQTANTLSNIGQIVVQNGGVLRQAKVGQAIPTATWNSGSTCEVTGWVTTLGGGLDQSFSNFTWNCASQSVSLIIEPSSMSVSGLFKVSSTGASDDIVAIGNSSTTRSLTVGSLQVSGGRFAIAAASATAAMSLTVSGNCTIDGGTLQVSRTLSSANTLTVNGTTTISSGSLYITNTGVGSANTNINSATLIGDVLVNGGTIDLVPTANDAGPGRLFVRSNLTLSSGSITNTRAVSTGTSGIYFDGTGLQTFTYSAGTLSTSSGSVGRRFYYKTSSGPTINEIYGVTTSTVNGSEPASLGVAGYAPFSTISAFTINNSAAVTLSESKTISGTLTLSSGSLNLGGNTLTLNSGSSAQSITGSGSNAFNVTNGTISLTGSGAHTKTLSNFGTTSSGGLTLGSDVTLQMNSNAALDCGGNGTSTSLLTVLGTMQMNSATNSNVASSKPPFYGNSSTLEYKVSYGVADEWKSGAAITTPGVPQNVTINGSSIIVTSPTSERNVKGNLLISVGNFTLNSSVGGDLKVAGNITNNATFTHNNRAVYLNGSSLQTLNGSLNGTTTTNCFPYLFLDNTSGGVTLNTPVNVSNTLTLTTGVVTTTSTNLLHITNNSAAAMSGGSSTSYINGPLRWSVSNSGGGDYKFHVGKSATYLPFNINNPSGTAPVLTVEAFATSVNATPSYGNSLSSVSSSEYWLASNTGALTSGTISLAKGTIGSLNAIASSTNAAGSYTSLGGSATSTLITSNTVTAANTSSSMATPTYFVLATKVPAPTISSFTPSTVYVGTTITITGTDFTNVSAVSIGGVAASSYTVNSSTSISAVVAASALSGTISVTTPGGTATSSSSFTFSGYVSAAASDWNSTSTWLGGALPPASSAVTIDHAVTVNGTVANDPSSVTINSTKSLTFGASGELTATSLTNNGSLIMTAGGTLTIASGGTLANGTNTFTYGAGTVAFAGTGTITGTIGFNNVTIAGAVNFGTTSTINGTLSINTGGSVSANAPIYASGSTLKYNSTGTYGRSTEWNTTSGAGYPHHVQISTGTILDLGANSGTATARQIAGNMTVDNGTTLSMALNPMTAALTVKGDYFNYGTTILSSSSGGDLVLEGNLTDNATFTANSRAIFFQGSNTQSIYSSDDPLDIDVARFNKTGGEVILSQNLLIDETADPVQFAGTSILNLSIYSATFGKTGTTSSITMNSTSAIKGSANANLTIYGSGEFGAINFDQTTPGTSNQLGNLLIQRSSGSVTLGNSVSINGSLTLSSGKLIIGANTLTLAGTVASMNESNSLVGSSTSNLTVNGTGTLGTLYFDQTTPGTTNYLNAFTLNRTSSGTMNLANNLQLASLTITNGEFIENSSKQLTVNGTLTNNGILTLNSGATLVQGTSSAIAGSGTYNVKQNITGTGTTSPNGRFWYLGAALSNASSTALLSSTGNQLWQWNESGFAYETVLTGQTLTQGKSYVLRSGQAETINFSGTGLSNGTVTLSPLSRSGTTQTYRGCHLISNPYPSYLDWNSVTKTNIGTTMYVRTAVNTTYDILETFNSTGNVATNNSGTPLTQYIAPMQGFWVKVAADGQTGSLTMNNSMRSHQSSGVLRSTPQDFPAFLRFNMIDGQNKDQVILLMSPDASMSLDNFDSEKMSASGYAQFYSTVNATKLVINGMKNVKAKTSVPLTLVMPTSKSYTFQAEEFNIEDGLILLEDKQEGVIQDLTINPTYSFFGNAGTNATRFVVHFQLATAPVLVGGPQELESLGSDELMSDNIQIVSNNQGTVIVRLDEGFKPEGNIRVFDASGRLVDQTDFNDQETTIHLNEQAGMYFVEVSAGKLMVKKKIVIN